MRNVIRPATSRDVATMQLIEAKAGRAFSEIGMREIGEDPPASAEEYMRYIRHKRAWVIADEGGCAVAYVLVDVVDGCAHVEQVSVSPEHARKGLGAQLIEHVERWASERGLDALTLTTFADVPWNAPYYARLGFRPLAAGELGQGLQDVRAHEAAIGLDRWPRIAMRRALGDHTNFAASVDRDT